MSIRKLSHSVSKEKMAPLTAKLKCPYGRREVTHESETVTEVGYHRFGRGAQGHLEGGIGEDGCVPPAGQTRIFDYKMS